MREDLQRILCAGCKSGLALCLATPVLILSHSDFRTVSG
jgi:hypothetical protein